jgi:transposase
VIASMIETALCRARHNAVYAACRTMPNGIVFPRVLRNGPMISSA